MVIAKTSQSGWTPPTNTELAEALRETGDLLEEQGASPFRVRAYRQASETVAGLATPIWQTLEAEGIRGLIRLPRIGRSIAAALQQLVRIGSFSLLDRLRGEHDAEDRFTTVADIGPTLARRIHERLGIESLLELAAAAQDGRLAQVPGLGEKRVRAVRESLAGRFGTMRAARHSDGPIVENVPIATLLDVDREYREAVEQNRLPRIAPKRFNPTREAWLPILHTDRGSQHFTALFSNSHRAHELGTTRDWVVIYQDDHGNHGQWTVITANFGKLRGRRIVRGREPECDAYYANSSPLIAGAPHQRYSQRMLLLSGADE